MLSVFDGLSVIRPTAAQKRLRGGDALCRCWCFFTNNFPKRAVGPPLFVVFRRITANAK